MAQDILQVLQYKLDMAKRYDAAGDNASADWWCMDFDLCRKFAETITGRRFSVTGWTVSEVSA
jgi:hypothetical protein